MKMSAYFLFAILSVILTCVFSDTPANCSYADIEGKWVLSEGERGHDKTVNCSGFSGPAVSTLTVVLYFPDLAVDSNGNEGFWTVIYNQGFEVRINGRKYFAFSAFVKSGSNVTSYCNETLPGWSHDIFDRDWACYASKKTTPVPPKHHQVQRLSKPSKYSFSKRLFYRSNPLFIHEINKIQKSWAAVEYKHFEKMTMEDLIRMAGGRKSKVNSIPTPAPVSRKVIEAASSLPESFDWRNMSGVNYVSPIRNQESCGSCYSFASMAMNEARVRIMTNNQQQPVFSPQDIVECSEYSQGCEGGFPYLISGKYGEDFGLVEEKCNPYKGVDGHCTTDPSCPRHYSTKYEYIGGFYGACNEPLMRVNLVKYGPIAVGFEVYKDFLNYKGGIYHHTFLEDKFNPFELTNHAVLVVGYGADPTSGEKFWIVKNSWGESWGEQGFFRIRRGNDECAMESMAVQSFPII